VVDEVERRGVAGWKSSEISNLVFGLVFGLGMSMGNAGLLINSVLGKIRRENGFAEWKQIELTNFVAALVELNVVDGELLTLIALRATELYGIEPLHQQEEEEGGSELPPIDFADLIQ
jgi:hypothetical protein